MTKNQIDYERNQEIKRANLRGEEQRQQEYEESKRHAQATENIDLAKLNETQTHNRATERVDLGRLNETIRDNKTRAGIDLSKLAETVRSNQANERIKSQANAEIARSNRANENIRWANLQEQQLQNFRNYTLGVNELKAQVDKNEKDAIIRATANEISKEANSIRKAYNDAMSKIQDKKVTAEIRQNDDRLALALDQLKLATDNADWDHAIGIINSITGGLRAYSTIGG